MPEPEDDGVQHRPRTQSYGRRDQATVGVGILPVQDGSRALSAFMAPTRTDNRWNPDLPQASVHGPVALAELEVLVPVSDETGPYDFDLVHVPTSS